MHTPIPFSDRPAIERRRGAVLRAMQAVLLRHELNRLADENLDLEKAAIDALRCLNGFGLELRRRVIR